MDVLGFSTQCKVRQCFLCQGDTEFYCNTCKNGLCLQCKDRHVIDLNTIYHDVVIYREKYEYIPKQETCVRHPDKIYEMFCKSCELPVCFQCKEHRKHSRMDIKFRSLYKTNRQQKREIIHNIRSDILYKSCFLLAEIKFEIKTCPVIVSGKHSDMLMKSQRLKSLIDTMICDFKTQQKSFMMYRLNQQNKKMNRHLASIGNYEHRFEQLGKMPVKFLLFLKKTLVFKIKGIPTLSQHILLSLTKEINMDDVIMLLNEVQIVETVGEKFKK
ncbi:E3 ubiquitin-protein ligase TRIM63-like [Saccostrea cucullata]|uniref:E3 ubiquitin-protein ligase TRIM63-like n=1 Tax=Saccostrea cuccullata TaxID=36930 RepID=UPI002ED16411